MLGDIMVEIALLVLYITSFIVVSLLLSRLLRNHMIYRSGNKVIPPVVSLVAQIKSIWIIIKHIILSPPMIVTLISFTLIIALSAYTTTYHLASLEYTIPELKENIVVLEFSTIMDVREVLDYIRLLNIMVGSGGYDRILRLVFDEVLELPVNSETLSIYSVVLVDKRLISDILTSKYVGIIGSLEKSITINFNGTPLHIRGVKPEVLEEYMILNMIPLLPIQGYVAAKPVYVPPENTIILEYDIGCKLLKVRGEPISTLILYNLTLTESDVERLFSINWRLSKLYIVSGGRVTYYHSAIVPSPKSLFFAILSSILASIMIVPAISVIASKLRVIEYKASLSGLTPNVIALSASTILTLILGVLGLLVVSILSLVIGIYTSLNTIITLILTLIFTYIYTSHTLASTPYKEQPLPIPQSVSFTVERDISELVSIIEYLIRTNEFFKVIEYEITKRNNIVYIHVSARYLAAWGVGVDSYITLTTYKGNYTIVSLTYKSWSVEEISNRYLESVVRLFVGRLIGGLTPWRILNH